MKIYKTLLILVISLTGLYGSAQNPHTESGLKKVTVQEVILVESTLIYMLQKMTKING